MLIGMLRIFNFCYIFIFQFTDIQINFCIFFLLVNTETNSYLYVAKPCHFSLYIIQSLSLLIERPPLRIKAELLGFLAK